MKAPGTTPQGALDEGHSSAGTSPPPPTAAETQPSIADRLRSVCADVRRDLRASRLLTHGVPNYVLHDPLLFRNHRFDAENYGILVALNSDRTLGEIFAELVEQGQLAADQEEAFYQFIVSLYNQGLLNLPLSEGKSLYARFERRQAADRRGRLFSVLFWRVPLVNPDAFLDRTVHLVRFLFTRAAVAVWAALVLVAVLVVWTRWSEFKSPLQSILAGGNWMFLWGALVALKVVHELGHAYACKVFGGRVPEMGAYFILFTPCAYVDATSSWGFPRARERIAVGLAGMYFESVVALLAVLVWSFSTPSPLASYAHMAIVLSSVMTIGFNINPLMRYDGYYVLSDLIGVPNLRQKSVELVQGGLKRAFLGIRFERRDRYPWWVQAVMVTYGVATPLYRIGLTVGICAAIATKLYLVGIGLAAIYLGMTVFKLLTRLLSYLWTSPETTRVRIRGACLGAAVLLVIPLVLAAVPASNSVVIEGTLQRQQDTPVYATAAGFVTQAVEEGEGVEAGWPLYVLQNPAIAGQLAKATAEVELARLQRRLRSDEPVQQAIASQTVGSLEHVRAHAAQYVERLTVHAPFAGHVVGPPVACGRYVREGELLGHIVKGPWIVVCQARTEDLADGRPAVGQPVQVRMRAAASVSLAGTVQRVDPFGTPVVGDAALTQVGGGSIAVDPSSHRAAEPYFRITIRLDEQPPWELGQGMRALVRCQAASETWGSVVVRQIRRFIVKLGTSS